MRWLWLVIFLGLGIGAVDAQPANLPSKPARYVSDRAFVLDEPTIDALNTRLENFERDTSNQLVVAIFANLPPGAEIAQYSTQVFRAWGVGQADKDNGVVLFIFKNDRKLFISTGRGLEGALPDVTCKQIIENEIVPRFKAGDFAGGISGGVDAIMAATKGEYKGTGKTVADRPAGRFIFNNLFAILQVLIVLIVIFRMVRRYQRGDIILNRGGYGTYGGSWSSGGGGWSSGGGGGGGDGGGGGFSGGGGSSSGGGAGGSW